MKDSLDKPSEELFPSQKRKKLEAGRLETLSDAAESILALSERMTANRHELIRQMPEAHAALQRRVPYSQKPKAQG